MTNQNDWSLLGEELDAIKASARHEGYQKAISDMGSSKDKLEKDIIRLREEIGEWHTCLAAIRRMWAMSGMAIERGKNESVFGHKVIRTRIMANMPADESEFVKALMLMAVKAQDFQILLDTFETNEMVKSQWEKLLVMMRMTDCGT